MFTYDNSFLSSESYLSSYTHVILSIIPQFQLSWISLPSMNGISDSGVIEFGEFLNIMAKISLDTETESDLVEVFRVLDQDGDG